MQPNTITLAIDELNNGTSTDKVMSRYDYTNSRSLYISPDHTPESRQEMSLFRSPAKPTGNFLGVKKTSVKLTWDRVVPAADGIATVKAPSICECGFSLPVGMTAAEQLAFRQTMVAVLDHAFMTSFQSQLDI